MTRVIILAAGKGTRMESELPKVLVPLKGRPMISYLMDSVGEAAVDPRPIVVVSPENKEMMSEALASYNVEYVVQEEQLGTGHAVASARQALGEISEDDSLIVLYGDHPFLKVESIRRFAALKPEAVTVMPTKLSDFSDWRQNFLHWGRFVRNAEGRVEKIVEFKDASDEEKQITEVNPGFMCFNLTWLFSNIDSLRNDNKQKEYYLTDMVKLAFSQGHEVGTLNIEAHEAMGINSLAELQTAESLLAA